MIDENETPWSLLDEAVALGPGQRRAETLAAAIDGLDAHERTILEARAVARAMQALDDPALLSEAEQAFQVALAQQVEPSFMSAHLAEALLNEGRFELALAACERVNPARFEQADLHWRNARVDQIKSTCLIRLDRLDESAAAFEAVVSAMETEQADDFIPAPTELVALLIEMAESADPPRQALALASLASLEARIALEHWFPVDTIMILRSTLAQ